jgi:starch phosphorylase
VAWWPDRRILGMPYNLLVPGFRTTNVNTLRLWSAHASESFDLQVFNTGDYTRAVENKTYSENISKVLYPDDTTPQGKALRLQQQYFFVACSLADILRNFRQRYQSDWDQFPEKAAIQLNDTHPSIAIAELMRLLVDVHLLPWDQAWEITRRTFGYTVHTLLPEALEEWPISIFEPLLPRHLQIIYEINQRFLEDVRRRFPRDNERAVRMSLIREAPEKRVRMAHLACLGSNAINGVAELQSYLLRENTLRDFYEMFPDRFSNKTNGVTPRRFIGIANPRLANAITNRIGDGWLTDLDQLRGLEEHLSDPSFSDAWRKVKKENKLDLARIIRESTGVEIDPDGLFDVMVKRLHEYKRQLLKVLHTITLYYRLKDSPSRRLVPRTVIFGAKAAPGYRMAKLVIKLINNAADVINQDPQTNDWLRMAFVPNFNVTTAQWIYPAADLSEQISLAGKEASGTGNMKFALNGAVTIGTLDGANIEIRQLVGSQNFFLFGLTADEAVTLKRNGYKPRDYYQHNPELRNVLDAISQNAFSKDEPGIFQPIIDSLLNQDEYLLLADYQSYIDTQDRAVRAYLDPDLWTRMSILNTARCGYFSSDRAIRQYCEDIWKVKPIPFA